VWRASNRREPAAVLDSQPAIASRRVATVHAGNERARRFYAAGGWQPDGAVRDEEAFGHVVQEIRYRISLR
jgi:RimJ/RimL family protein N-acetyltransferase